MILFILSFVAGILTVLAPCTLPLLPIIVGSTVAGVPSKKKVFTITISLGVSIVLFTLLLKVSSALISVPQEVWGYISGTIIIVFGLITLFPNLWESLSFVSKLNVDSNRLLAVGYKKESFWGNVIIGASLGPVFSSCSPTYFLILATVLPQSFALGLADLFVYAIGLSGTLILVAFASQKLILKLGGISDTHGLFRKSLGVVFIIVGVLILFGIDKKIQASLLAGGIFDITRVEQSLLKFNEPKSSIDYTNQDESVSEKNSTSTTKRVFQKTRGPNAPELVSPNGYINTEGEPITLAQYKGKKVVLLDIWTYTCINCQRTIPYVESWYEKYKDEGLVVIGLHTPEFAFEKVKSNVEKAVREFGITYPVVMDNNYLTWSAYGNQYWPRKYLISGDGEIVYDHIGEGNYEETEKAIQRALSELNQKDMDTGVTAPKNVISVEQSKVQSPESYFGSNRNEYFGNGKPAKDGIQTLTVPQTIQKNLFYLDGTWNFSPEYAMANSVGKIIFKYNAKNVYIVASSEKGVNVTVLKDGKKESTFEVKENRLYDVIKGEDYGEHTLEINFNEPGLTIFAFTFG